MRQQLISEIALNCYAIVSGNFAMFCDPESRGTNFTWQRFPEMQERQCAAFIWMHMATPRDPARKQAIEDKAAEFGREIAATLIRRANFVSVEG